MESAILLFRPLTTLMHQDIAQKHTAAAIISSNWDSFNCKGVLGTIPWECWKVPATLATTTAGIGKTEP